MRKLLTIAASVLGYWLIEAFLLLWVAKKTGLPEMLFLVSTALMFAAFFYGGRMTARRALLVVAWVIASPAFMLLIFAALLSAVRTSGAVIGDFFEVAVPIMVLISAPVVPAYFSWRARSRNALADADRWLSDRERYGAVRIRRRSRLKRWSLFLPSGIVLCTLFFWAEVQGVLNRPLNRGIGELAGYKVDVPLAWTPAWRDEDKQYVVLMKLHGLGPATLFLGHRWAYRSTITVDSSSNTGHDKELIRRNADWYHAPLRTHLLNGHLAKLSCWEYVFPDRLLNIPAWSATCVDENGTLAAHFNGDHADLDSFYEIVSSAEVRK